MDVEVLNVGKIFGTAPHFVKKLFTSIVFVIYLLL